MNRFLLLTVLVASFFSGSVMASPLMLRKLLQCLGRLQDRLNQYGLIN